MLLESNAGNHRSPFELFKVRKQRSIFFSVGQKEKVVCISDIIVGEKPKFKAFLLSFQKFVKYYIHLFEGHTMLQSLVTIIV